MAGSIDNQVVMLIRKKKMTIAAVLVIGQFTATQNSRYETLHL